MNYYIYVAKWRQVVGDTILLKESELSVLRNYNYYHIYLYKPGTEYHVLVSSTKTRVILVENLCEDDQVFLSLSGYLVAIEDNVEVSGRNVFGISKDILDDVCKIR